jgi:hypothetical protein
MKAAYSSLMTDCEMVIPAVIITYIRYLQELFSCAQLMALFGRS